MSLSVLNAVGPPVLVRQQAFQNLRNAIISGEIKPGSRLIERELCEALGISRASVREVIRQLEAERLVIVEPRRGPTVSRLTRAQAEEIYELRAVFESQLAQAYTRVATDEELQELQAIHGRIKAAAERKEVLGLVFLMVDMTNHMGRVAGKEVTLDLLNYLGARISALRVTSVSKAGRIEESMGEIQKIVDAILARDVEGAGQNTRDYVHNAGRAALERLA
ncbi:GntR family transcriptional regulator [Aureimonas populi]|uniref:GntR family transcriptional regulator n=1 Tax=Aureimonas populi TaxID=1701758 RepID=A0ABW5CTL6_9HYPH|nr:GntR family transcriptional regulator [Aureimonas populi]